MKRLIPILLLSSFISSCAQRIKVPITRMISPEAMGGGFQLEYQQSSFSHGVLDFKNKEVDNALLMTKVKERTLYTNIGVADTVDIFSKVHKESSSIIGLKIQVLGQPRRESEVGNKLAITLGMGAERDKFNEGDTEIELKSDVTDFSFIHGYRINEFLLLYDGISLSNYSFTGNIKESDGLNGDSISYKAKNILGVHAGAIAGSGSFNLKLEYGIQKIKWSDTKEEIFQDITAAVSVGW